MDWATIRLRDLSLNSSLRASTIQRTSIHLLTFAGGERATIRLRDLSLDSSLRAITIQRTSTNLWVVAGGEWARRIGCVEGSGAGLDAVEMGLQAQ